MALSCFYMKNVLSKGLSNTIWTQITTGCYLRTLVRGVLGGHSRGERRLVAIYPKEAHKIRVRWLLLAQNTSLPTWCFVGVLIQLFVQQLYPVFSVTKLQMIICHAQHSLVGRSLSRSTIGIDLLNTILKIVTHMQKIKKLTMIFYYGSNATYIKIYRYGYLIIRDAFYETAL